MPNHKVAAFSQTVGVLLLVAVLLGCDPAMSIRQSNISESHSPLVITVKEDHPFIGTRNYAPSISVTNGYDTPISIERVDLRVNQRTYSDRRLRPQDWPVSIAPKRTEQVMPFFDLGDSVWHVLYGKSGELRVSVAYNGQNVVASATVTGGKLR